MEAGESYLHMCICIPVITICKVYNTLCNQVDRIKSVGLDAEFFLNGPLVFGVYSTLFFIYL